MISFNSIPIDIRTPGQYIEFDNSRAFANLPAMPNRILVLGQRLAAGTIAANVPTLVTSAALAERYFGRGSQLSAMFNALKAANAYTETWAIAQDDNGAGVAATGTIALTGPATAAGTLNLLIGGSAVAVAVASGDTATTVGTALAAAINADTTLPVTAAGTATVTLTAQNKGENGNAIDLRQNYYTGQATPGGLTVTITAMGGVVAGATNPDIAASITAMGGVFYSTLITPYTDSANLIKLETELARRWGPLIMQDCQAFGSVVGTHAQIVSLGTARNSQFVTLMGAQKSPTPPWIIAAITGAVDAYEPDPARPRQTLPLPGILPPAATDRYTQNERNIHLKSGVATFIVDSGGKVLIERLITTYQTNAYSVADVSYLDIETMRTLAYLRYSVRARISQKYPRHKLANDGTNFSPGQAIVTPKVIRAELITLFQDWMLAGLAEDIEQFKTDLVVERNPSDVNRVDALIPPNCVNQFRVFAAQVQFRL